MIQPRTNVNRRWNFWVNQVASSGMLTGERREAIYRRNGIDPNSTQIRTGCWFFSDLITFGKNGMINIGCVFENREPITLGDRCFVGPQVLFGTSTHEIGSKDQRAGDYAGAGIIVGDGVWIGARATILPGVAIADGCVIGAGAVVTADTEPHGLYVGVGARRIRDLPA